jgi:hypothetical protein
MHNSFSYGNLDVDLWQNGLSAFHTVALSSFSLCNCKCKGSRTCSGRSWLTDGRPKCIACSLSFHPTSHQAQAYKCRARTQTTDAARQHATIIYCHGNMAPLPTARHFNAAETMAPKASEPCSLQNGHEHGSSTVATSSSGDRAPAPPLRQVKRAITASRRHYWLPHEHWLSGSVVPLLFVQESRCPFLTCCLPPAARSRRLPSPASFSG